MKCYHQRMSRFFVFCRYHSLVIHVIEMLRVIKRFPKQKSNEFKFNTSNVWFSRFAKNHGFVMTKESGAQTIRYGLGQRSRKTSLCAPFL